MRYALIIAGGSGTRLWPMSRQRLPKQLLPFIGGRCLLEIAVTRLQGLVPVECQYICAGESHRDLILRTVPGTAAERFYGEPVGRDTLNAVGLAAVEIHHRDPDAVIAVFTADHIIQPVEQFRQIVAMGFQAAETQPNTLVTFGITPTHAATGYGYLELGAPLDARAFTVRQFKEKPDQVTAGKYLAAGPDHYLWNSGMFVWRAATLLRCIAKYAPENFRGLQHLGQIWHSPECRETLAQVYPTLPKISVDYAVLEPASRDPEMRIVAVPMPLSWLDVGSWPAFADVCEKDPRNNSLAPAEGKFVLLDTQNTLVATSDPRHVVATIGCENLIIIHTPDATLVCRADRAEDIKKVHALVGQKFGAELL